MPDLRALLIAVGVGLGVGGFLVVWWHWPLAAGGGVGIVLGGLALIGSMSVGEDPGEADEAFRTAAPDLLDPPAFPTPGVPVRGPGRGAATAAAEDLDDGTVGEPEPRRDELGADAAP